MARTNSETWKMTMVREGLPLKTASKGVMARPTLTERRRRCRRSDAYEPLASFSVTSPGSSAAETSSVGSSSSSQSMKYGGTSAGGGGAHWAASSPGGSGSNRPLSDRHLEKLVGAPEHNMRRREPGCA